jgi:transcriptional regulator with XRE-family HTH domain
VPAQDVGRRVRAARAYARLSASDFAQRLGTSRTTLLRIERGERVATAAELDHIARICGVPRGFLSEDAVPARARGSAAHLAACLRGLRDKLDRLIEPVASDAPDPRPIRDEASALLDALDPSFDGLDPRLVRALEHPLRMRLLSSCVIPRSARELSDALEEPLDDVVEQLEALVRVGAIVRTGEAEYQAAVLHLLDDRQIGYFPVAFRRSQHGYVLDLIQRDVRAAMPSGGFDPESVHISRSTLRLDARGYEELIAMLSDARRTYGDSEEEIETELAILHFHREPGGRALTTAAERS